MKNIAHKYVRKLHIGFEARKDTHTKNDFDGIYGDYLKCFKQKEGIPRRKIYGMEISQKSLRSAKKDDVLFFDLLVYDYPETFFDLQDGQHYILEDDQLTLITTIENGICAEVPPRFQYDWSNMLGPKLFLKGSNTNEG